MKKEISVLILATLPDSGIKSLGSKSFIEIAGIKLIDHQIRTLTKALKNTKYEIIVLSSFDCNKMIKYINTTYAKRKNIKIIKQEISNLNFGGALIDGFSHNKYENILSVNYGCCFTTSCIKDLIRDTAITKIGIIKDINKNLKVGCVREKTKLEHLFFDIGLEKFTDMFYLNSIAVSYLKSKKNLASNMFTFELLNHLIEDDKQKIECEEFNKKNFLFLDSTSLINKTKRIFNLCLT